LSKQLAQRQLQFPNFAVPACCDFKPTIEKGVVIRPTLCRTILNKTNISDYSLNCYTGCTHACVYCYARFMQRFHPHAEPWGKFVDVKTNAVEVLCRQLRRAAPGEVFVGSACDAWQPVETRFGLSRRCCEMLLEAGFELNVLTKSASLLRGLDIFKAKKATIGVTVTSLDEHLRILWEPGASPVADRFELIRQAKRAGLKTAVMFGPLLPDFSDTATSIEALLRRAAELQIDTIWFDALNPRPKVWPSITTLLRSRFPHLLTHYRQILFEDVCRRDYLASLRRRITAAADKFSLSKKVTICF
jgi:DNA repair photolyase